MVNIIENLTKARYCVEGALLPVATFSLQISNVHLVTHSVNELFCK